jgi:integrase
MNSQLLTARAVATAKPKRNTAGELVRNEIPDGTASGLYLSIEPTGRKSWIHRYRANGKPARRKPGDADTMSLLAARAAAAAGRHRIELNPVAPAPAPRVLETGDRIEALAAEFLARHAFRKNRLSTAAAAERIFNRLVLLQWRGRSVHDIKRRDVIELVEKIATDSGGYMSNRTLGVLSKFFNWLCGRDVIEASPVVGVERVHKEEVRSRTLSDAELRALWLACEDEDPFGQALKLLVLTGTRRNEVSQMKWGELDEEQQAWILPSERSKNARQHTIPLPSQAWALIQAMPRLADCPYVFSADGRGAINGWAKAKSRLSEKAGIAEESWRLHDLRRTCAAGMQRLGIRTEAIERALNHRSGVFRGIVSRYQTDRLDDEVRVALQRWADRVGELASGKPAKVIALRK